MTNGTAPAIGMSVGAATLAAVTADRGVTRRPVLTRCQRRPARLGTPAEVADSADAGEPGAVFADFVDRVGDPEPIVADDGSTQPGAELLADALHALAYLTTDGQPLPATVGVAYPARWPEVDVAALRTALGNVADFTARRVSLVSDVDAALTALRSNPGLPAAGIILVCDFGSSGSSITLVDAGRGYRRAGATVFHTAFSGESIDRALLDHVVDDLTSSGSLGGAPAIGSLHQLRDQCREAKEQLSTTTVTEVAVDLPGYHGPVWLTRAEVDGVISEPLDGFIAAAEQALQHKQIQQSDLSAVVTIGGGAAIPAITTALSQHFGATVVSAPRPQLTAAIGAALLAAHGQEGAAPDSVAPAPRPPVPSEPVPRLGTGRPSPGAFRPAPPDWVPDAGMAPEVRHEPTSATLITPRPAWPPAEHQPLPDRSAAARVVLHRRSLVVILAAAAAVLIAGAVAVVVLRQAAGNEPDTSTVTTEPTAPQTAPSLPPPLSRYPVFPEIPTMVPTPLPVPAPAVPEPPGP